MGRSYWARRRWPSRWRRHPARRKETPSLGRTRNQRNARSLWLPDLTSMGKSWTRVIDKEKEMATRDINQLVEDVRRSREVVVAPGGAIEQAPAQQPTAQTENAPTPQQPQRVKPATFGSR